ncbi:hypothetical protein A3H26_00895 [candidate division WWE3 bacterium RIFCSPLOWO2_12_FULL_36_10]|uniref:Uncharacterized protein n=1 Tax=candidate division WWE3 bacterium RIFCSPLOWO2_12_FULL_36_10 TaxID=1802630 RepID=A0A1F4VKS0_UNCKA|nr:MAG: hypothetical protein A3H26_00895 [candidate division WWE3 bacterium RIFCSPLOWO2_12_FULL_36_10]
MEGLSESHQEWPNSDRSLALLTRYVEDRHRQSEEIKHPRFLVNKDDTVTMSSTPFFKNTVCVF